MGARGHRPRARPGLSHQANQDRRALPGRRPDRRHGPHRLGPPRRRTRPDHRGRGPRRRSPPQPPRPGGGAAGGGIGAKAAATADPAGYTILMTPGGALTTGPAVHRNIGYDPAKVFTPVGLLMVTPNIISVHPSLPVKSLAEVVAYAKANPGQISWGPQRHAPP